MIFITARPLAEWEATEPCYNRRRCAPIAMVGALLVLERLPHPPVTNGSRSSGSLEGCTTISSGCCLAGSVG
jgi:hypothetical protein